MRLAPCSGDRDFLTLGELVTTDHVNTVFKKAEQQWGELKHWQERWFRIFYSGMEVGKPFLSLAARAYIKGI